MNSNNLLLENNDTSPDVKGLSYERPEELPDEEKARLIELWQKQNAPQAETKPQAQSQQLNVDPFKKNFQKIQKKPPVEQEEKPLNTAPFVKAYEDKQLLENENTSDWLLRGAARTAKDVIAGVGGTIGNLRDVGEYLTSILPEIPGNKERIENNFLLKNGRDIIKKYIPTTEDINKFADEQTEGYTEAKTGGEKFFSEVVKSVAGRKVFGGSNKASALARAAIDIGVPLAGEAAKEATGYFTDSGGKKEGAKLGTMVLLDLLVGVPFGNTRGYTRELTNRAINSIDNPNGVLTNTNPLVRTLSQQRQALTRGGRSAAHDPAIRRIDEAIEMIHNGTMTRQAAYELRLNMSQEILGHGGYDLPQGAAAEASRHLHEVRESLTNALNRDAISTGNMNYIAADQAARNAYRVYQTSNRISNYIQRNYGTNIRSVLGKTLFYGAGTGLGGVKGLAGAGVSAAAYQGMKLVDRMLRSPELLDLYSKTVASAAQNNLPQMKKYLKEFDEKALELEKNQ